MKTKQINLKIYDIVGDGLFLTEKDGQKVYDKIVKALRRAQVVNLSFFNCDNLTSHFLDVAIGQLYNGEFTEEFLSKHILVSDIKKYDS